LKGPNDPQLVEAANALTLPLGRSKGIRRPLRRKTARAAQAPAVSPPGLPLQTRPNLGTFSSESTTLLVGHGRATRKRLVPDLARSGSYCMRSPQATRLYSATWSRLSSPCACVTGTMRLPPEGEIAALLFGLVKPTTPKLEKR
jgi:hypothetical protein